jgi:hypothetical protein
VKRSLVVLVATTALAAVATLVIPARTPIPQPLAAVATTPPADVQPSAAPTVVAPPLVPWKGPVEELFVHPLVLRPSLAFRADVLGRGFADYFVTAQEFRSLLDQLWQHGWTLVDVHRAAAGTVRVPAGRKPLVLSEDDVNYYRYFAGRGLADRLVLDGDRVRAQVADRLTDEDVVPLVEAAIALHPELSAEGAKGVLAVTGYEGLLGEHDVATDPASRDRLRALADRLRATGWTFASHTFGHITLAQASVGSASRDTARWRTLTGDLLGPVDVLIYPFGSRPSPQVRRRLGAAGFRIQLDIDIRASHQVLDGVVLMSRRHVDGLAFAEPARQAPFYDVRVVARRPRA